jgi:hypothetical protein
MQFLVYTVAFKLMFASIYNRAPVARYSDAPLKK